MNQVSEMLSNALQAVYPGIVFDTEGLASLLLPCLAIVLVGLIITLLMKIPRKTRRFAYLLVTIALIAMIAASAFIPASLMHIGEYAVEKLQQTVVWQQPAS